jgi:hypothetical protein
LAYQRNDEDIERTQGLAESIERVPSRRALEQGGRARIANSWQTLSWKENAV